MFGKMALLEEANLFSLSLVYLGTKVQPHWIWTILCIAMADHGCLCKYRRLDCRYTCEQRTIYNISPQGKDLLFLLFMTTVYLYWSWRWRGTYHSITRGSLTELNFADYAINWISWPCILSHSTKQSQYSSFSSDVHGMQSGLCWLNNKFA